MENRITSRYANILLDYWFKRSFGNESGKRLMILTLREILPEVDIEDITYGSTPRSQFRNRLCGARTLTSLCLCISSV